MEELEADFLWLDDVFAMDFIIDFEAACYLAGYDYRELEFKGKNRPIESMTCDDLTCSNPIINRLFEIIKTWGINETHKSLYWYIDYAIFKDVQYVRDDLLLPKCQEKFKKMHEIERKKIIDKYPYLAGKLNLGVVSLDNDPTLRFSAEAQGILSVVPQSENSKYMLSWKENAKKIFRELRVGREHLSLEYMSNLVRNEMQKKYDAGEKGMTKRGGKKIPMAETIRRHALEKL
jgi:hypothetical protein